MKLYGIKLNETVDIFSHCHNCAHAHEKLSKQTYQLEFQ